MHKFHILRVQAFFFIESTRCIQHPNSLLKLFRLRFLKLHIYISMHETVCDFPSQWYEFLLNFHRPLRTCTQPRLLLSMGMAPGGAGAWLITWSLNKRRWVQFLNSYVWQKESILLCGAKALHLLLCKRVIIIKITPNLPSFLFVLNHDHHSRIQFPAHLQYEKIIKIWGFFQSCSLKLKLPDLVTL